MKCIVDDEELFNIKAFGINAETFRYIFSSVMRDKLFFVAIVCFSEMMQKFTNTLDNLSLTFTFGLAFYKNRE